MKRVLFFCLITLICVVGLGFCLSVNGISAMSAELSVAALAVLCPVILKKLPGNTIKTPCSIVYMAVDEGKAELYMLPYLDLCRREDVWGIEINGVMVQATDAPSANLASAHDYAQKTSKAYTNPLGFPSPWQAMCIMLGRKKFERTVSIMHECGIEAERFAFGDYWCDCKKPTLVYLNGKKSERKLANPFKHAKNQKHAHYVRLVVK